MECCRQKESRLAESGQSYRARGIEIYRSVEPGEAELLEFQHSMMWLYPGLGSAPDAEGLLE